MNEQSAPAAALLPKTPALAFIPGIAERLGYYVYALRDPLDNDRVFYVGKGKRDRVYQHAAKALEVDPAEGDIGLKLSTIRAIHGAGKEVGVEILRHGLSQHDAYEVEAAVIDAFGLISQDLSNGVAGHGSRERGWAALAELRARYAAEPIVISSDQRAMLIRINRLYYPRMTDEQLYEATRQWWTVRPARGANYAFAIYQGIVREVYAIDRWEGPTPIERNGKTAPKWAFHGHVDTEQSARYSWRDVSAYFPRGLRAPIIYVNC